MAASEGEEPHGVFAECEVAFCPSDSLTPNYISKLAEELERHGGTVCEPRRDGSIPIDKVTHIVSNTIDFPQYVETQAVMIPVVTAQWIITSIGRRKLAQVRPYSPDPRMIFARVVVTCADLPEMDKESIIGATLALGGQESKDVLRMTTHICALSMEHPKVETAMQKGWKGKLVLPHWFDDCFKLGKRIDEGPYLLPDPEILNKSAEDDLDIPANVNLEGATSANPEWLPLPPNSDSARPPVTVFQDQRVFLCSDLHVSARLSKVIKDIIVHGNGRLVEEVDECTMFIGQYREGEDYLRASRSCKVVGNLSWLYSLIVNNQWKSPLHRLLHYPIPKTGIEGFKGLRITVSNYGGEARIYLENLIKACGAEFTKTMRPENTHLITARDSSEKCKAAPEWGVAVVNHLWIEESYAKCEMKQINVSKFNHFPPRTNLGEIIGQTFFNENRLRELYYPGGEEQMSPRAKRKRKVLEAAEDNAYRRGPAEGVVIGDYESVNDIDMTHEDDAAHDEDGPKRKRKSSTLQTPVRSRHSEFGGKENDTPLAMSTGGRSAKAKARDLLQHIAPDIALYEKEKKRHSKSGAPFGGKRATDLAEREQAKNRKPAAPTKGDDNENDNDTGDDDDDDDDVEEAKRPAKKSRPSRPDVDIRLVVTGYDKWVGNKSKEDRDRRTLRELGIQIVQEGQPCDYLAAPHIVRTVKFLCALARGATVINSAFIDAVIKHNHVPYPLDFVLQDKQAESKYNINIEKSAGRAKSNRGKLLQGIAVYCTEKIKNGADSYRIIAEANGAIFKLYRARSGTSIRPTTMEEDGGLPPDPVYLLSGVSNEEKELWPRFTEMAANGNMEARIVAPDWLLDVAMAQQVRFNKKFLVKNFHKNVGESA